MLLTSLHSLIASRAYSVFVRRAGCLLFFLLVVFLTGSALASDNCTIQNLDLQKQVVYVHDADTLWLQDNDQTQLKLRIIGMNAPEVANRYDEKSVSEPFGIAARDALRQRLTGHTVLLDFDEQKLDKYKRLLAHVFFADGHSVTEWLLAQGLAQAAPFAPNFEYIDCYTKADRRAQANKSGLWNHPYFAPKPAARLRHRDTGFMRVQGCVVSLSSSRRNYHVYLSDAFRFTMDQSLPRLQQQQCVIVRGWVYNDRNYPGKGMRVFHQAAIENVHVQH